MKTKPLGHRVTSRLYHFLDSDQGVRVTLDLQARVMLLDEMNYHAFRSSRQLTFYGGWATRSPVTIAVPHCGTWHVVIDLEGRCGTVRAGVSIVG